MKEETKQTIFGIIIGGLGIHGLFLTKRLLK